MNYRTLETGIKIFLLIITAYIAADAVSTMTRGALHTLPSFTMPEKVRKKFTPPLPPVSEEKTEVQTADTLPPLVLVGTVVGAHPYAVILDAVSKRQEFYRVKAEVSSGWHIHKIDKNKVVLKKGGREEYFEIKSIETEADQVEGGGNMKQKQEVRNSVRLSPPEVESALADLNKIMTQARVIPNIVEGKTIGYKIFNIVPGSIYTKIGIMNNDIIERVNGVEINSPDMVYKLFQQMRNESRIALDLKRGEGKKSIVVEIR